MTSGTLESIADLLVCFHCLSVAELLFLTQRFQWVEPDCPTHVLYSGLEVRLTLLLLLSLPLMFWYAGHLEIMH